MENVYYVTEDKQGGYFGMGRLYTAKEWLDQTVEWHDHDDYWDYDTERQEFIDKWTKVIEEGNEQDFIDYIAGCWELEFVKGDPEVGIPAEYDPDELQYPDESL